MLTVAIPKRNKLQNIIVLTPKDGSVADVVIRADSVKRRCMKKVPRIT